MTAKKSAKGKSSGKKKAQPEYKAPSTIKVQSKYGKSNYGQSGKSQVTNQNSGFKVQHKG